MFYYYANNFISAKDASFALCEIQFIIFINVITWALALSVRFAEDVWYSCWRSAHCDRGEWNISSCNWWVCTCASFSRNPCFSPAAQTQGSHASYWDQLLPSHHALCANLDSPASPSLGWLCLYFFLFLFFDLKPWAHVQLLLKAWFIIRENMKCFYAKSFNLQQ